MGNWLNGADLDNKHLRRFRGFRVLVRTKIRVGIRIMFRVRIW